MVSFVSTRNKWLTWVGIEPESKNRHSDESIRPASIRIRAQTRKAKCNLCLSKRLRHTFEKREKVKCSFTLCTRFVMSAVDHHISKKKRMISFSRIDCQRVCCKNSRVFSDPRMLETKMLMNHSREYWYIVSIICKSERQKNKIWALLATGIYRDRVTSISACVVSADETFTFENELCNFPCSLGHSKNVARSFEIMFGVRKRNTEWSNKT